jgi:alginate O-acetyltransferase complex protein AlgJ
MARAPLAGTRATSRAALGFGQVDRIAGHGFGIGHAFVLWNLQPLHLLSVLVSSWAILEGQITIVLDSTSHEKTGATGACALEARVGRSTFDESDLCADPPKSARNAIDSQKSPKSRLVVHGTDAPASSRSYVYRWALVALFGVGISLPLLDWRFALDHTPELTENRVLAPAPAWPLTRAEWQALPPRLEKYWNDAFGFRRVLIRWHSIIRYQLGISPSPIVIIGKHSRLFYAGDETTEQHRGLRPFTTVELDNWTQQLEARRKWLETLHARYLFVVAPDKQSIYPEDVPARYGPPAQTPLDQLLDYLRSHSKVEVLDLRGALLAARASGNLYHYTDSHWNDRGAFVGYSALLQRLHSWYPALTARPRELFSRRRTRPWNGDMAMMVGGIFDVMTETSEQWVPLTRVLVQDVPITGYRPPESRWFKVFVGPNPTRPRLVVFHDSFMLASDERIFPGQTPPPRALLPPTPTFRLSALLAEQFSRSAFTWQYGFDAQLVESEHPDLVIEEHIERQLRRGPDGAVPNVAH